MDSPDLSDLFDTIWRAATLPAQEKERLARLWRNRCRQVLAAGPDEDEPTSWLETGNAFLDLYAWSQLTDRPQG